MARLTVSLLVALIFFAFACGDDSAKENALVFPSNPVRSQNETATSDKKQTQSLEENAEASNNMEFMDKALEKRGIDPNNITSDDFRKALLK